jgi:hypothetical protein
VLIIGPGSHQRTSSPHAVYSANISDDEHIVGEDTKKSSRWQKQVPDRCVKTQKVASTSSPSAKPGHTTVLTCAFSLLPTVKLLLVMICSSYERVWHAF